MDLIPGNIYVRKEVHDEYGGSRYSGITPTKEAKKVFIWSNESGPHHGYQDGWSEDKNIYYYTGAGLRGDQELEAPMHNGRLLRHIENGDEVLLFTGQKGPGGLWKYECKLSLIDYEFFQTKDTDNKNRRAVRFILERIQGTGSEGVVSPERDPTAPTNPNPHTKPTTTERKGLVTSRVGQGYYRRQILQRFAGKCAVTGANSEELLIASHIVPWRDSNDSERLDVNNGILLSPNYDALFDRHLISFSDDGQIIMSESLQKELRTSLGISSHEKIKVFEGMKAYLERHRANLR